MDPQQYQYGMPVPQQPAGNQTYPQQQAPPPQVAAMQQGSFRQPMAMPTQPSNPFQQAAFQGSFSDMKPLNGDLTYAQPGMMQQPVATQPVAQAPYAGEGVMLSNLPHILRDVLDKYDTNRDGILDHTEMMHARQDMAKMRQIVESGRVPMSSFPETARQMLEEHDKNNDGELDVVEIIHGFEALQREKRRKHQLMYFSTGLILFSILLLVAVGGLMAYVIRLTKDTEVEGSVMYVKGTTEPIQTSASEFTVKDGMVVNRASDTECADGQTCESPLKVSQAVQEGLLSSRLPDTDLQELKQLRIANGESWIQFEVLAVARYAEDPSRYGTVVVIYTHIGELTLDGDLISFHEALEGAFSRAGFDVVGSRGSRRRLMGVVQTIGMFNFLSTILDPDDVTDGVVPSSSIPRVAPFTAEVRYLIHCDINGLQNCHLDDGTPVDWITQDGITEPKDVLSWTEAQEFYNVSGALYAKTEKTSAQYPDVVAKELFNGTHRMSFVQFANEKYHCWLMEDDSLGEAVTDQGASGTGEINPDDYTITDRGLVKLNDPNQEFQMYSLSDSSGHALDFYTHPDDGQRLYQLSWQHSSWRFLSLDYLEAGTAPDNLEEYDFDGYQCNDGPEVEPPPMWVFRRANAYSNSGVWGQPSGLPTDVWEDSQDTQQVIQTAVSAVQAESLLARVQATEGKCLLSETEVSLGDGEETGRTLTHRRWGECESARRSGGSNTDVWNFNLNSGARRSAECLTTTGEVDVIRDGASNIYTSGSFTMTADPSVCFANQVTAEQLAVLNTETSSTFTSTFLATENPIGGQRTWFEMVGACTSGASAQMGMMKDAHMFNLTRSHSFSNVGSSTAGVLYSLAGTLEVKLLLLSNEKCAICQPNENDFNDNTQTVAFRLSTTWSGTITWNMCQATGGGVAPCGSADATGVSANWAPSTFADIKKSVFPGTNANAGTCQTSTGGVYRYECRCPNAAHWDWPACSWCQDGPLGLMKVAGVACTTAPNWNPSSNHVNCP